EATARQVMARMVASGWLQHERVGRAVHYRLTERAQRRFAEARPLNAHLMRPEPEETEWVLLLVTVPPERQSVRHRLRRRLAAGGWGSVGPSAWLGTSPRCEIGLARTLDELELCGSELLLRGDLVRGDPKALAARAWDLDSINERYRAFTTDFGPLVAHDDREAFRARTAMIDAWHRSFNSDPHLPADLLPADWCGQEAREVVRRQSDEWTEAAARWWRDVSERTRGDGAASLSRRAASAAAMR
ncbi:MAG TPA: PaaX family transcriptional regulator C-terminal domain-containing protein, partial [Acidimicrobiales bacterium]